jgi:hypothetical protein
MRNAYKGLAQYAEWMRLIGRHERALEYNIKMDVKK